MVAVLTESRPGGAGAPARRPVTAHLTLFRPDGALGVGARVGAPDPVARRGVDRGRQARFTVIEGRCTTVQGGRLPNERTRLGVAPMSRGRRPDQAVYRRRRLMAVGLLLLAIAAVLGVVQLTQAGIGGGPLTATGAAAGPGMIQAGATEYVVRPGDTLWSIAAALEPGRDERPLVDQLVREIGGTTLYPGEVIPIPART